MEPMGRAFEGQGGFSGIQSSRLKDMLRSEMSGAFGVSSVFCSGTGSQGLGTLAQKRLTCSIMVGFSKPQKVKGCLLSC